VLELLDDSLMELNELEDISSVLEELELLKELLEDEDLISVLEELDSEELDISSSWANG
jgi:hypothetical protein